MRPEVSSCDTVFSAWIVRMEHQNARWVDFSPSSGVGIVREPVRYRSEDGSGRLRADGRASMRNGFAAEG